MTETHKALGTEETDSNKVGGARNLCILSDVNSGSLVRLYKLQMLASPGSFISPFSLPNFTPSA